MFALASAVYQENNVCLMPSLAKMMFSCLLSLLASLLIFFRLQELYGSMYPVDFLFLSSKF